MSVTRNLGRGHVGRFVRIHDDMKGERCIKVQHLGLRLRHSIWLRTYGYSGAEGIPGFIIGCVAKD